MSPKKSAVVCYKHHINSGAVYAYYAMLSWKLVESA